MRRPKRLIVVSHMSSNLGRGILAGIREYCQKHGQWEFQLEANVGEPVSAPRVKRSLAQWKPDGILAHLVDAHWDTLIAESGVPAVTVSNATSAFGMPSVSVDQSAVGQLVAHYFLNKGLKNFGYCGYTDKVGLPDRRDGFCRPLRDAGFECSVLEGFTGGHRWEWVKARRAIEAWLATLPKPVGIMCCHDYRGQEVLGACREMGLAVPDDVSVVGVENDDLFCTMSDPPMSSVEIPGRRIGYEAAALLHKLINGRRVPRKHISLLPVEVVARASSEKSQISDPDIVQALQFIADNADKPITVKDILKDLLICRRSFERRFKEMTGRTPKKQMIDAHIARTKRLLVNTDLAIPEVATQSGFVRPGVLSRAFRRQMGIAPIAYRKRFRVG